MQTVQLGVSCACVHSLLLVLVLVHTMQLGLSCACGHRAVRSLVLVLVLVLVLCLYLCSQCSHVSLVLVLTVQLGLLPHDMSWQLP